MNPKGEAWNDGEVSFVAWFKAEEVAVTPVLESQTMRCTELGLWEGLASCVVVSLVAI